MTSERQCFFCFYSVFTILSPNITGGFIAFWLKWINKTFTCVASIHWNSSLQILFGTLILTLSKPMETPSPILQYSLSHKHLSHSIMLSGSFLYNLWINSWQIFFLFYSVIGSLSNCFLIYAMCSCLRSPFVFYFLSHFSVSFSFEVHHTTPKYVCA